MTAIKVLAADSGMLWAPSQRITGSRAMSKFLAQLESDHVNVAKILAILERELKTMHQGDRADFGLMSEVMVYMTRYPDAVHHPMEDLMFQRMKGSDSQLDYYIDRLEREHEGLAVKGAKFLEMLQHVVDGALVERGELEARGVDYVAFLRSHMQTEDQHVFPRAEELLSAQDWKTIAREFADYTDPVFGPVVENEYRTLLEQIQREGQLVNP